ncbi:DUF1648 domain-containing protein [Sediminibacillus massiliensis]|uniref:DUF1648 domain-containing protein n=1 Tax=Sediminibacillus massiliensis TaxID=1926277 RepID=UPI0009884178|nr:DUF5808 domain-containing protein [Sediminibacillus massiliensis]
MNSTLILLLLITVLPVFIGMMFMPYLTRRTESFGVWIPEDVYYTKELRLMRKKYVKLTGVVSLLTAAVYLFALPLEIDPQTITVLISVSLLLYIFITFLVYLYFHRKMKTLKAEQKWGKEKPQRTVIQTGFRNQKLTYSNGWFLISFILSFGMILFSLSVYDQIPDQIPMQYNFNGEVTNWENKSYRSILLMPAMMVYLSLLFLGINTVIAKAKQQLNAENPEKSIQQSVIFRRRWSAFIIITGIAMTLLFSLIQLSFIYPINSKFLVIAPLVLGGGVTIGAIVLSFTTGQGGSRVKTGTGKKGEIIDRDDDKYWKLGQFYYNPNDPALFLEKRFGVGWTLNLARPLAWVLFLSIIILAVGIPLLLGA